jgi:hypothetical protein
MVIHPSTALPSSAGTTAPESLLIRYIQAHIKKGELANERADQSRQKAEEHFVAAGAYLAALKTSYAPTWQAWESLLKIKVKLSVGRASELMQIADGRKSVQGIRDATAQRVKALRANHSSSLQSQCNEEEEPSFEESEPELAWAEEDDLINTLARSTPAVRGAAVAAVVKGSHQTKFEQFRDAVADLYQQLAKAGR